MLGLDASEHDRIVMSHFCRKAYAIVTTIVTNSILTVRNPAGNAAALTITPLAGGTRPDSAHLVIMQIG